MNLLSAIIIEDEPQIRRFVSQALQQENWNVFEAATLKDGLIEIATRQPDLLILDLGLPDGDGITLIKEIQSWSRMPIIVLSARHDEQEKIKALDAGANDYLCKPFGIGELLARVRASQRKINTTYPENTYHQHPSYHIGGEETPFTFGNIHVDRAARMIKKDQKLVHLTPTEYRLLIVLIANVGRVMTHRQLLKEVWGSAYAERGHYVRIYMGHLRQKLEDDPSQPKYFLTETAVGYRLAVEDES